MYKYDVKINPDAYLYTIDEMNVVFPNLGEILIQSKVFHSLEECDENLTKLLSMLTHLECKHSGINHVVVVKRQPTEAETEKDANMWEDSVTCKFFVCDSEKLKQSEFVFSIMAQIQAIAQESSNYH